MSDHPTWSGPPDRPLWGPVRRPGEVTSAGPLDPPAPDPEALAPAAPSWPGPGAGAAVDVPAVDRGGHDVDGSGSTGPSYVDPGFGDTRVDSVPAAPHGIGTVESDHAASRAPGPTVAGPDVPPLHPAAIIVPVSRNPYAGTLGGDLYGASGLPSPPVGPREHMAVPPQWAGPDRTDAPLASTYPSTPPVPPNPPAPATGGWNRTTLVAVTATCAVALLIAGSGVVWAMNRVPEPAADSASVSPASVDPAPASSAPAPDLTVRSVSGLVKIDSTAATHPLARPVAELLDRHFTSINTLDYPAWASTVSSRRATDQSADQWRSNYRSTRDGDVHITSISDDGSGGLSVGLRFTSQQDVADAPADLQVGRICWSSRWPVTGLPSDGTIGTAPKGTTTKQAC